MANCGQACPYNTLDGCKVKEYNAICPLTNMATPITEYRMTNADRIRAMSDEELAHEFAMIAGWDREQYQKAKSIGIEKVMLDWLRQSAKE